MTEIDPTSAPKMKLFSAMIPVEIKGREDKVGHREEKKIGCTVIRDDNGRGSIAEKRPNKALPYPRCKSTKMKFCYFNNYNVNQPRHFCKGCRRYWTAGGTLRNIPLGAGRRKANLPSHGEIAVTGTDFTESCVLNQSEVIELGLEWTVEQWSHVSASRPTKGCSRISYA